MRLYRDLRRDSNPHAEFTELNLPRSRFWKITAIVLPALGVAIIDYSTGSEIRVFPFYFLPIALAASSMGRRDTYLITLLCTILWLVSNALGGRHYSSQWIWFWNTFVQGAAFMVVATLVLRLQEALRHERDSARTDTLTGLLNVRAFHERAPALIELCHRESNPIVIAYIDLDNFKKVNDVHGHQRGDEVLHVAAQIMKSSLRATDLLARFGGDEFVALLPNASTEAAVNTLERLRESIESSMRAEKCDVTASIGAAAYQHAPQSLDDVICAADSAMYAVKQSGKNRVQVTVIDLPA